MEIFKKVHLLLLLIIFNGFAWGTYSDLVQNVSSLSGPGTPGPIWMSSDEWVPLIGSSATSIYPVCIAAREWGRGRIIAAGGFFDDLSAADNGRFVENVFTWLCQDGYKNITYLEGCWFGIPSSSPLYTFLTPKGFLVSSISVPISAEKLDSKSCLIIGNMWGYPFTPEEIAVVSNYVSNGGGLLLLGLGWSWYGYHPDVTIYDYPMMQIAAPYSIRWLDGYLPSTLDCIYPNLNNFSLSAARDYIYTAHQTYSDNLASVLQTNTTIRTQYFQSNTVLKTPLSFESDHSLRASIYQFYKDLINDFPTQLTKDAFYDSADYPAFVQSRETMFYTFLSLMDSSSDSRDEVADILGLTGLYRDVFVDHGLFLMDNGSLNEPQKQFIYDYKNSIPPTLDNLSFITVKDLLGSLWYDLLPMQGDTRRVNIFKFNVGQYQENSFPSDSLSGITDIFSMVVAHEHNHIVDAHTVRSNPQFAVRKHNLIKQASPNDIVFNPTSQGGMDWVATKNSFLSKGYWDGNESSWNSAWNAYWSSGVGQSYNDHWLRNNLQLMCEAPQEAFATLSNQYFTESEIMLDLAIRRWNRGIKSCINQFLFFVNVYSSDTNKSYFYKIDAAGNIQRKPVCLEKNQHGEITKLAYSDRLYEFYYNDNWEVQGISESIPFNCAAVDFDCSFRIDLNDLIILADNWLQNNLLFSDVDVDGDTAISMNDFIKLASCWQESPLDGGL